MVYSRFFSALSVSFFVTTSLCAAGKTEGTPPLKEDSSPTPQRRGSAVTLEGLLASGPNTKAAQSTAQQKREESKKKKKADPRRLSRAETGSASKLAEDARKRRSTLCQTGASTPELSIVRASTDGTNIPEEKGNGHSGSSGDSKSPSPLLSPREDRRNSPFFSTFLSAAKKLFEIAGAESSEEDLVIGDPSKNTESTKGKAFDREHTATEIDILVKRIDAMGKLMDAHLKSYKQLLARDKYDFVLKGDLHQLSQMCIQGLRYCDSTDEYKDDDAIAYLQNLKRFSDAVGIELLWAMGAPPEPEQKGQYFLLDQKLKDAKEKRDTAMVSESLSTTAITHPIRRRRTLSVGSNGSQDRIVAPTPASVNDSPPHVSVLPKVGEMAETKE